MLKLGVATRCESSEAHCGWLVFVFTSIILTIDSTDFEG